MKCNRLYKRIYSHYPKTNEAVWAMYHSARLFTRLYTFSNKTKDLDTAIKLFKRLQNNYKTHSLADDALYRIGEIYYKYKKDPAQAYLELIKLDRQFPSGDMRPKA